MVEISYIKVVNLEVLNHSCIFDNSGYSALMISVLNWNEDFIRHLMNQPGTDLNIKNNEGDTALHIAVREQSLKSFPRKIENQNKISAQDLCKNQEDKYAIKLFVVQKNLSIMQMKSQSRAYLALSVLIFDLIVTCLFITPCLLISFNQHIYTNDNYNIKNNIIFVFLYLSKQ